jgi:hypothetical protein
MTMAEVKAVVKGSGPAARGGAGASFGLVLLSLLLPLVSVSSCDSPRTAMTTTGVSVLVGAGHVPPGRGGSAGNVAARPFVLLTTVAAAMGLALVASPSRRAAIRRLALASVGLLLTMGTAVALRVGSLFDDVTLGPGYWLGLAGFLAAGTVDTVGLVRGRRRRRPSHIF